MKTKILDVNVNELDEWSENPFKRSTLSDEELYASIEDVGILEELAVVPQQKKYIVIDGNRRLRIAKKIGLKSLSVKVYYEFSDKPLKLAIELNTRGRPWDMQTVGQFVAANPQAMHDIPVRYSQKIKPMIELLNGDFATFIKYYPPNAYIWGMKAASYVGRKDDREFCKKAVFWVGKHKLNKLVRLATDLNTPPGDIEKAILKDKPLRQKVISSD